MEILIQVFQLLLSLSILVVVHEFGHFAAAKIFKTRVEKFYLFFNPWFSIFKFNFKGTEYGLGWLPLGGYVKISGMIDESMDKEAMKEPPKPWEFRSKPAWQRLIIMLGGVIMNVVLAFLIYIAMLTYWGDEYLSTKEANKYGIRPDSLAMEMGFQNGDRILYLDGESVEDFNKITITMVLNVVKNITVIRDGEEVTFVIPEGSHNKLLSYKSKLFELRIPFIAEKFTEISPAKSAGMIKGDQIVGLNGQSIIYYTDFREEIQNYKNQDIIVTVLRENDSVDIAMVLGDNGLMGVYPLSNMNELFDVSKKNYTIAEAIPAGFSRTIGGIDNYLKQLKLLFSPEVKAYEGIGGFITIGSIFPTEWHWESFWRLTAFLSIMLAILNILPIPALDGGHVLFLVYEIVARRKPSDKFLEYAQVFGMIILLGLLVLANGNDIARLFN
ncbi:MAG: RIP metalloprotease RseP [Lentimicrobiaceae bacterium]|nr:RIP metalloprotease RseP [Lentimicrobiaceae bacterium]MDG1902608.1 RIP metalloprotease RseP [Bacteroidales bacterium]MDG2081817.1 RIP metalloprotease RseP [Bacteroidales bacterium]|tara:strand:- start:14533 stop:15858 length:1326 start_codon:yes stop_codon:yes gene_type:complete